MGGWVSRREGTGFRLQRGSLQTPAANLGGEGGSPECQSQARAGIMLLKSRVSPSENPLQATCPVTLGKSQPLPAWGAHLSTTRDHCCESAWLVCQWPVLTEHLLCARLFSKHFTFINSVNPPTNPVSGILFPVTLSSPGWRRSHLTGAW